MHNVYDKFMFIILLHDQKLQKTKPETQIPSKFNFPNCFAWLTNDSNYNLNFPRNTLGYLTRNTSSSNIL